MCGRYATSASTADLAALFEASAETGTELAPDYNVAPTTAAPIVRRVVPGGDRAISLARWGFLPPWARDARGAARMINARAETVASSRAFGGAFAERRCLVPADGWYEWRRLGAAGGGRVRRQAYFMTLRDGGTLAMAGVWGVWGRGDERRLTYSIVTTAAVGEFSFVHDRMPLVLPPRRWAAWLGDGRPDPARLLEPPPEVFTATLEIRPVGPRVGDVRNGGAELVERVSVPEQDQLPFDAGNIL